MQVSIPQIVVQNGGFGQFIHDLVPSVVARVQERTIVGTGAHRLRGNTELSMKRNATIWWDTKNEIGTKRVYRAAPENLKYPRDIAREILYFLHEAAKDLNPMEIDQVVITVPASFQVTQREDTLQAAKEAGFNLEKVQLMDEPVAAFLDYVALSGGEQLAVKPRNRVMVVDFGGGTCDVALIMLAKDAVTGGFTFATSGVSRFHRIGGSDIDNVIAHDILLPKLMAQNNIGKFELNYLQKRDYVIPGLAVQAESLKKKISDAQVSHLKFSKSELPDDHIVTLPNSVQIPTGNLELGVLELAAPSLTVGELNESIKKFIDRHGAVSEDSEYLMVNSMFVPIKEALFRVDWEKEQIDTVLLVGGTSQFTSVKSALVGYFPAASIVTYEESLGAQRCVGRGAALQALLLAVYGKSPLKATIGEPIKIMTGNKGFVELIPGNTPLPLPTTAVDGLTLPVDISEEGAPLKLEFQIGSQPLTTEEIWIEGPLTKGTKINTSISIDTNQHFDIEVNVASNRYHATLSNPLSVVANPNAIRDQILAAEEKVSQEQDPSKKINIYIDLAELHQKIGENERARQLLEDVFPYATGNTVRTILHRLGLVCGELGDFESQTAYYKKSIDLGFGEGAAFNLALALSGKDHTDEALEIIDALIKKRDAFQDLCLRGYILEKLKRGAEAQETYLEAIEDVDELEECSDFELHWLLVAARATNNDDLIHEIEKLRKEQKAKEKALDLMAAQRSNGTMYPEWNK
jgi:molecular chaperone DnaK (HSP70)